MILEKLSLANYRGFEQLDLTFDPRITVIAGVNGIGKSGILHALALLFSHAIPQITPARQPRVPQLYSDDDILLGKTTLTTSVNFSTRDVSLQAVGTLRLANQKKMQELDTRLKEIRKELRYAGKTKNPRKVELKHEEQGILSAQKAEQGDYQLIVSKSPGDDSGASPGSTLATLRGAANPPVVMSFTPNRQVYERPRTLASPEPFEPPSAYVEALDERTMRLGVFMAWFNAMQKLPGKGAKKRRELVARLRAVVTSLIPEFTDLRIEETPRLRFLVTKSGLPLSFDQLSDGERGMLAILFDITRRLAIANPESNDPVAEGTGIVLIDEIELHLHPLWQRQVLKRFADTFKGCQFVVTSHSPLVLGEVEGKAIRFLYRDDGKVKSWTPEHALGLDANRVLEDVMGVPARDPETEAKLHEVAKAIDKAQFDEAGRLIASLEIQLGDDDADLVRSKALMSFLEGNE